MDMLKQLNASIAYIESNLCAEFDLDEAARIACLTADSLGRFFSYMTGMSLAEYIRRRKLTLAADDIRCTNERIVDIAVKYGYESAAAFSRAFAKQHGIKPSAYRRYGGPIKAYSPASFHITVKGAKEMDFRIIELPETEVFGISRRYDGQGYETREELRHIMWSDQCENIPGMLCEGCWNEKGNTAYDGVWYGIWHDGGYMVAREKECVRNNVPETYQIPAGTYAAFRTKRGGLAWEELPKLFELIYDSWLPGSGYKLKSDLAVEVFHLWTDHDTRRQNRYYEILVPVELLK